MSGIAGIFLRRTGMVGMKLPIQDMLSAMRHRARDGCSWWADGDVALGHAWLNTTDEAAPGPHVLPEAQLSITADCRLDDREELLARLGLRDGSLPDAALILNAYLLWGEDCTCYLRGDFAFVIWDGDRHSFFCARDHFGVKPLYYCATVDRLLLASEIRPILAISPETHALNEYHIAAFLAGLCDDQEATAYRGIFRLPPSHALTVNRQRVTVRRYWQPEPRSGPRRSDAAEEFRHLFTSSVRNRLRGTRAVGAMLSGGLDSSSIACVARRLLVEEQGRPLPTFSMIFENGSPMDERPFIDAVLAGGGFESHYVRLEQHAPFQAFDRLLEEQEGTFLAPGLSRTRNLYAAAEGIGIKVLLNGHGGDEVVSHGFRRLHELANDGQWLDLWREVQAVAHAQAMSAWRHYLDFLMLYGPAWRFAKAAAFAARARRAIGMKSPERFSWPQYVNAGLASRTDLRERFGRAGTPPGLVRTSESLFHRWQLANGLVPHAFEVLDKTAASFGIEPRYPFWDKPLVEFCLSLPAEEKLKHGWSRLVLRRAMDGILPPEVQWRRDKIDFRGSLAGGIARFHQPLVEEALWADGERIAEFVELPAVRSAYRRLLENPAEAAMEDLQSVWRSVSLFLWLRQIENQGGLQ